jgi:hypothetical protein
VQGIDYLLERRRSLFPLDEILNIRNRQLRSVEGTAVIILKAVPEEL